MRNIYLFSICLLLVACSDNSVDLAPRRNTDPKAIDGSNQPSTKTLKDVIDDPGLVDFLPGKWGNYWSGDGLQYHTNRYDFTKSSTQYAYTHTYNTYRTLIDVQIIKGTYSFKVEKSILYKSSNGSSFSKVGRMEKISDDEMKFYEITETSNSSTEFPPYILTRINETEEDAENVIKKSDLKELLKGVWSAGSTSFDFTSGKNHFTFSTTGLSGAKSTEKREFKVAADGTMFYRKWADDFNPAWKTYKIRIQDGKLIVSNPNGTIAYTLTK